MTHTAYGTDTPNVLHHIYFFGNELHNCKWALNIYLDDVFLFNNTFTRDNGVIDQPGPNWRYIPDGHGVGLRPFVANNIFLGPVNCQYEYSIADQIYPTGYFGNNSCADVNGGSIAYTATEGGIIYGAIWKCPGLIDGGSMGFVDWPNGNFALTETSTNHGTGLNLFSSPDVWPSAVVNKIDRYGNPYPESGPWNRGAVQATGVAETNPILYSYPKVFTRFALTNSSITTNSLTISNARQAGTVDYTITEDIAWLSVVPSSGSVTGTESDLVGFVYDISGMSSGDRSETVTVNAGAAGTNYITVQLTITNGNYVPPVVRGARMQRTTGNTRSSGSITTR